MLYAPTVFMGQGGLGGVPPAGLYGFGYGSTNYLMMPTSFTMQNIQAIEMQNTVTLSNYTFNIVNNIISVFPIPGTGFAGGDFDGGDDLYYGEFLVFDFIKIQDRIDASFADGTNKITNTANAPYVNPVYSNINSIGKCIIHICKEACYFNCKIISKYSTTGTDIIFKVYQYRRTNLWNEVNENAPVTVNKIFWGITNFTLNFNIDTENYRGIGDSVAVRMPFGYDFTIEITRFFTNMNDTFAY